MGNMESEFNSQKENPLAYLQVYIRSAPKSIEKELARSDNPWLACFATILTVLLGRMRLHGDELKEVLSPEGYNSAWKKLTALEKQVKELQGKREFEPPEELKQELLDKVNLFE